MSAQLLKSTAAALPDFNLDGARAEKITGGGSDRVYHRIGLGDGSSMVHMRYGEERPDNLAFVPASSTLARLGVAIPDVLAHDAKKRSIWLQDLGDQHLYDLRAASWEERAPIYKATLDEAAKLHGTADDDLEDAERDSLEPPFDAALYSWEQDYFFEHFLGRFSRRAPTYVRSLRDVPDFASLAEELAALPRALVHRDLQSQNVLLHDGRPHFIDYQGLRLGLPEYDIASLLYDPYVGFEDGQREELIAYAFRDRDPEEWRPIFFRCAAQRLMQALGAYGRLGKELEKSEFLQHIPPALELLREVLSAGEILPQLGPYLNPEAISL